jgi:hypothetical protein
MKSDRIEYKGDFNRIEDAAQASHFAVFVKERRAS